MRSQSPTTTSSLCHVTESSETLSASEHDRRAMTSGRIQQRIGATPRSDGGCVMFWDVLVGFVEMVIELFDAILDGILE
jgi:hypothetical protein